MPLPSPATKANCDASTDDPKLALLTDLANLVDTVNALITAVGAEFAPLANPTLTGNPNAPTQTLRNNTTRLATTAFVLANMPLNGVLSKAVAYTLVAADYGKLVNATTGTWNLGIDPALGAGPICGVRNSGTGTITLVPSTGTIDGGASVALAAGESCIVESDGTNLLTVGRTVSIASYQSASPTTLSTNLMVAENHGLGARPTSVDVVLRCLTADAGYSVGDEVHLSTYDAPGVQNVVVWANATQVGANISGNTRLANKTTNATAVVLTGTNWGVVLRAWK